MKILEIKEKAKNSFDKVKNSKIFTKYKKTVILILAIIILICIIYQLSLNKAMKEAYKEYYVKSDYSSAYNKLKNYKFSFVNKSEFKYYKKLYETAYDNYIDGLISKYSNSSSSNSYSLSKNSYVKVQGLTLDKSSKYTTKATGSVYNYGTKTVNYVKVKVSFKNSSGTVIDTDWTYAVGSEGLKPGESKKFTCYADYDSRITSVTSEILDD